MKNEFNDFFSIHVMYNNEFNERLLKDASQFLIWQQNNQEEEEESEEEEEENENDDEE